MPFKTILVAVDFSDHSTEAIRVATDLARRFGAKLTLLHVFEPPAALHGFMLYTSGQLRGVIAAFEKHLDDLRKDALDAGAGVVEVKQLEGSPAPEICAFAKTHHFDLIVIGTHGRTSMQDFLLGSTAQRVLHHAPCPVLVTRAKAETQHTQSSTPGGMPAAGRT